MHFIATCFAALPDHPHMRPVASPRDVIIGHLEVEADEMWSFVKKKSEQTMDLDRHGQVDTAKHGVPRRELQSRECAAVVGKSCCDVPRAGDVLYRLIDIIANNKIDQKVVTISSLQPYSLVENSIDHSIFLLKAYTMRFSYHQAYIPHPVSCDQTHFF
jgi:hypothetical protein